ncbi:MAG: hypothetical protein IJ105_02610 [Bacilli bacterium]|nr:hypothetical protein [Bacilli bacterium]
MKKFTTDKNNKEMVEIQVKDLIFLYGNKSIPKNIKKIFADHVNYNMLEKNISFTQPEVISYLKKESHILNIDDFNKMSDEGIEKALNKIEKSLDLLKKMQNNKKIKENKSLFSQDAKLLEYSKNSIIDYLNKRRKNEEEHEHRFH